MFSSAAAAGGICWKEGSEQRLWLLLRVGLVVWSEAGRRQVEVSQGGGGKRLCTGQAQEAGGPHQLLHVGLPIISGLCS